jgi:hypothetical protein
MIGTSMNGGQTATAARINVPVVTALGCAFQRNSSMLAIAIPVTTAIEITIINASFRSLDGGTALL